MPRGKIRWREVRGGAGPVGPASHAHRPEHHPAAAPPARGSLGGHRDAEAASVARSAAPGHQDGPRWSGSSDGGRGLWRLFEEQFAAVATGILDFYHAAQNLWKSAAAWLDGRTTQARRWLVGPTPPAAWPDGVLADLAEALAVEGLPDTARDTLTTVYAYLDRHRSISTMRRYKALGLPLGSGMVESACKWLIQQRFKGVGMRWSEDGFNHLLHLRLAPGATSFGLFN